MSLFTSSASIHGGYGDSVVRKRNVLYSVVEWEKCLTESPTQKYIDFFHTAQHHHSTLRHLFVTTTKSCRPNNDIYLRRQQPWRYLCALCPSCPRVRKSHAFDYKPTFPTTTQLQHGFKHPVEHCTCNHWTKAHSWLCFETIITAASAADSATARRGSIAIQWWRWLWLVCGHLR